MRTASPELRYRYGLPLLTRVILQLRFERNGCIRWTGYHQSGGYGQVWDRSQQRRVLVHVVVYHGARWAATGQHRT